METNRAIWSGCLGECYLATWGGQSTLPYPQGTHARQLPANTPIYSDTSQPPETLNYLQYQQLERNDTFSEIVFDFRGYL